VICRTTVVVAAVGIAGVASGGCAAPEPFGPSLSTELPGSSASSVTVSNVTTGGAFDPDGFSVAIDGTDAVALELNESVTVTGLAGGTHTVALTGVASNCTVAGGATKSVEVAQESPAELRFDVACTAPSELASLRIVFARKLGAGAKGTSSLVAMNADGSGRVQLTSGAFNDYGPDPSPDGRRIAFMRDDPGDGALLPEVHVLSTDGSEWILLSGPAYNPDWSPDGTRIVFSGPVGHWGGPIMVARSDGGGATPLTGQDPDKEDAWPAWSPDGTRIAFTRAELGPFGAPGGIWVMSADGTGATRLSPSGAFPVWSPDGRRIVFSDYDSGTGLIVGMNATGTDMQLLLRSPQVSRMVVDDWSADGRFLLFSRSSRGSTRSDVYLLELATGATLRLTAGGAYNMDGAFWSGTSAR
jgi:TolB protein